jgi:ferrochelatase
MTTPDLPRKKLAVVLMNLGGPDSLDNIRPFLYNLFSDPAIIKLPSPLRQLAAWFISARRKNKAQAIYRQLGGKSPLLENTHIQQQALETALQEVLPAWQSRVFIAMRYWHPMSEGTVKAICEWGADCVVALPLYPQYSTTTTASSLRLWQKLSTSLKTINQCCYFQEPGFILAYQDLIRKKLNETPKNIPLRLLFSAHGIPQKLVSQGDPYQWQVEQSVAAIMKNFRLEYQICYQSKVGPLKWLEPSLGQEIERAAQDNVGVLVIPVTFVSEHSETLVELDLDFKNRANDLNLPYYARVATVGCHPAFIGGLAQLVKERVDTQQSCKDGGCPFEFTKCGCRG